MEARALWSGWSGFPRRVCPPGVADSRAARWPNPSRLSPSPALPLPGPGEVGPGYGQRVWSAGTCSRDRKRQPRLGAGPWWAGAFGVKVPGRVPWSRGLAAGLPRSIPLGGSSCRPRWGVSRQSRWRVGAAVMGRVGPFLGVLRVGGLAFLSPVVAARVCVPALVVSFRVLPILRGGRGRGVHIPGWPSMLLVAEAPPHILLEREGGPGFTPESSFTFVGPVPV